MKCIYIIAVIFAECFITGKEVLEKRTHLLSNILWLFTLIQMKHRKQFFS